jgi:endonuclease/exonuclease/phosphatase family metal-dependent hydrolase
LFKANQLFTVAGVAAPFLRGWVSMTASVNGHTFRFFSTHLEPSETGPEAQVDQGNEVLDVLETGTGPLVLVGDFNSRADGRGTATYDNLIGSGLSDSWVAVRSGDAGYTCCHASDLLNGTVNLGSRIDLVLLGSGVAAIDAVRVGLDPADRTASGLWASDHVGVVATLRIP